MCLHSLPTLSIHLQCSSFTWGWGESSSATLLTGFCSWGCISTGDAMTVALHAELWPQGSQEYPTDFAAVMIERRWAVRGSATGAATGEICTTVLWGPRCYVLLSFAAREYPKLTLLWLSSSIVAIVWISQPVPWLSHCPFPFFLIIVPLLHCDGVCRTAINIRAFKQQFCFL